MFIVDIREEAIQEDYQDKIVMQLAEQEEDDLERIEESRRRKQAILEKHKNKFSQKNELNSEETGKSVLYLKNFWFFESHHFLCIHEVDIYK